MARPATTAARTSLTARAPLRSSRAAVPSKLDDGMIYMKRRLCSCWLRPDDYGYPVLK